MNFKDYQKKVQTSEQQFSYNKLTTHLLGLLSEVGDLVAAFKKQLRVNQHTYLQSPFQEELGDILWYVSSIASKLRLDLRKVALENLKKTKKVYLEQTKPKLLIRKKRLNFSIRQYQLEAEKTDKIPSKTTRGKTSVIISLLGLTGETGDLLTVFKKSLISGKRETNLTEKSTKELGDILWYISNIATKVGLNLEKIAEHNIKKVQERYNSHSSHFFDENYEPDEQLPRNFEIHFREIKHPLNNKKTEESPERVTVKISMNEVNVGETLTDNSHKDDGYRYHDVFHLAFAGILRWSPVTRALLKRKRKSNPQADEVEDGARAIILEEAISEYIFNHARDENFFEEVKELDFVLLKTIKKITKGLEVEVCTPQDWETAILEGYKIFRQLRKNEGGTVLIDMKNRKISYQSNN